MSGAYACGAERAEIARDLIQETYLRLVANDFHALRVWRGDSEESFVSYLATVVHAVACDDFRRRKSLKRSADVVPLKEP